MKGTEVPNPRRSSACDCTCVLTRNRSLSSVFPSWFHTIWFYSFHVFHSFLSQITLGFSFGSKDMIRNSILRIYGYFWLIKFRISGMKPLSQFILCQHKGGSLWHNTGGSRTIFRRKCLAFKRLFTTVYQVLDKTENWRPGILCISVLTKNFHSWIHCNPWSNPWNLWVVLA